MRVYLNEKQRKGLANFFFDIAKGLLLGGMGFTAVVPLEAKLIAAFLSTGGVFWSLKMGLSLLED